MAKTAPDVRRRLAQAAVLTVLAAAAACSGGSDDHPSSTATVPSSDATTTAEKARNMPAGAGCIVPRDHARQARFGPHGDLGAFVLGSGRRWVLLGHQSDGDSCQLLPVGRDLAGVGFHVMSIDFSGRGSSRPVDGKGRTLAEDVVAAAAYARDHGARRVALLGASMGGYASLGAVAMLRPAPDAVVSLSAPSYFSDGGEPLDLRGLQVPLLLYVGRDDTAFVGASRDFSKQGTAAELHVLPTAEHGVGLVNDHVMGRIVDFLDTNLR